MNNRQIAEIFESIADLSEMKGQQRYTIVAYQKVARTIGQWPVELEQMVHDKEDLKEIPGVGDAIAKKIEQLVTTGKMESYEKLRAEFPDGMLNVIRVPGVGPKTAKQLWDNLGVSTVEQLGEAARDGSLAAVPRMGEKKAGAIVRALESRRVSDGQVPIAVAMPAADRAVAALREICPSIRKLEIAGNLRRYEETTERIDLICVASDQAEVVEALTERANVAEVVGGGGTRASVILSDGVQLDLRLVKDHQFGALFQYFTGNEQHNGLLREHAQNMGLSLSEYGITNTSTNESAQFEDEASLYERLGLQFIPPELREGNREVDAAKEGLIPRLVEAGDLKGDLHVHTDWSDGVASMGEMVEAAQSKGYEYVAITDHSSGRGIANGLTEERLRQHGAMLGRIQENTPGITLLHGSEVDIRANGTLDYPDEVLQELDWVVASVHSAMDQDSTVMTERIVRAMRNPHVHAIGHLSTRLIGERKLISADFEAIFEAAAQTGTVLEINASPERLDLKDSHVSMARELGVVLAIDSDAHRVETLGNQRYGVGVARRGWCEPRHILNTLPLADFMSFLRMDKSERSVLVAAHV